MGREKKIQSQCQLINAIEIIKILGKLLEFGYPMLYSTTLLLDTGTKNFRLNFAVSFHLYNTVTYSGHLNSVIRFTLRGESEYLTLYRRQLCSEKS